MGDKENASNSGLDICRGVGGDNLMWCLSNEDAIVFPSLPNFWHVLSDWENKISGRFSPGLSPKITLSINPRCMLMLWKSLIDMVWLMNRWKVHSSHRRTATSTIEVRLSRHYVWQLKIVQISLYNYFGTELVMQVHVIARFYVLEVSRLCVPLPTPPSSVGAWSRSIWICSLFSWNLFTDFNCSFVVKVLLT